MSAKYSDLWSVAVTNVVGMKFILTSCHAVPQLACYFHNPFALFPPPLPFDPSPCLTLTTQEIHGAFQTNYLASSGDDFVKSMGHIE
jgi:hypothetical protein